jgi:hypothetical protein
LGAVVGGFDTVYILSSTEEESASWLNIDRQSQVVVEVIGSIRDTISVAYTAGKVEFGPHRSKADRDDDQDISTIHLLANPLDADVVVFDDRALNKEVIMTDSAQRHVRVATTLDVIEELTARDLISNEERLGLRHKLRSVGASLMPIDSMEILAAAQRSRSTESPEFREISNSIRLARVREIPRFPAEIPWFLSVASGVRSAIKDTWRQETDKARAAVIADLLLSELPRGADWLPLWHGAPPPNWVGAVNRAMTASLALAIELSDSESRAAYFEWLEDRVLKAIRTLDPDAYRGIAEQVKNYIVSGVGDDGQ